MSDPAFVVIDVESGGLKAAEHALLQVSVVVADKDFKELDMFQHRVIAAPGYSVTPFCADLHKYTPEEWARTGISRDLADETLSQILSSWFGSQLCLFIAYNAAFDQEFVKHHLPKSFARGLYLPDAVVRMGDPSVRGWFCAYRAFGYWADKRGLPSGKGARRLPAAYAAVGSPPTEKTAGHEHAHDALADCRMTLAVAKVLRQGAP